MDSEKEERNDGRKRKEIGKYSNNTAGNRAGLWRGGTHHETGAQDACGLEAGYLHRYRPHTALRQIPGPSGGGAGLSGRTGGGSGGAADLPCPPYLRRPGKGAGGAVRGLHGGGGEVSGPWHRP